jgi:hypothetical protein
MTIYVVDLESVPSRYTCEWKEYVPQQIRQSTNEEVVVISGGDVPQATTPGAFLNFAGTNNYKAQQMLEISKLFAEGVIKDGDYFLYTDAWNPTVIQLKYMAELLGIKIRIGGLWHAGSYDPQDFLGRLIGDAAWVRNAEGSMFYCFDDNFFATKFHLDIFAKNLFDEESSEEFLAWHNNVHLVGWPMEYLSPTFDQYKSVGKRNLILFPHRIAPEKQVDIFRDLAKELPQYEFVVCQEQSLTKPEYQTLLAQSKMVFSANLQETLGISWYEGVLVDSIPMVPDRLSYSEMALEEFKYPSIWTKDFDSYNKHKSFIKSKIVEYMENYNNYKFLIEKQKEKLNQRFFSGDALYKAIKNGR